MKHIVQKSLFVLALLGAQHLLQSSQDYLSGGTTTGRQVARQAAVAEDEAHDEVVVQARKLERSVRQLKDARNAAHHAHERQKVEEHMVEQVEQFIESDLQANRPAHIHVTVESMSE